MRLGLAVALLSGCGGAANVDAGAPEDVGPVSFDAGRSTDAGAPADAGRAPLDAGARDAGHARYVNPAFSVPSASDAGDGMRCAWLDGDNCWKQHLQQLSDCLPAGSTGTFVDAWTCVFPTGHELEFSSPVPDVADAGTYWITAFRLRTSAGGPTCFETAYGLGKSRFTAGTTSLHVRNISLFDYEVVCPDASRFSNLADAGTCDTFAWRFLAGGVPGHAITCDADECVVSFTGMPEGRRLAARCVR